MCVSSCFNKVIIPLNTHGEAMNEYIMNFFRLRRLLLPYEMTAVTALNNRPLRVAQFLNPKRRTSRTVAASPASDTKIDFTFSSAMLP